MISTSPIVNRALRKTVSPVLREAGFMKVDARNGWRWLGKVVWVFNIRAVGAYFSAVTGWPPGSVGASLGVYFIFIPMGREVKISDDGRALPKEYMCQMRSQLRCGLVQDEHKSRLINPAERRRNDLWWIDPDGSNAESVATDIALSLREVGLQWFVRYTDVSTAFTEVEGRHDCFVKFDTAAFLARELGDLVRWREYVRLAVAESNRIGFPFDGGRYGV